MRFTELKIGDLFMIYGEKMKKTGHMTYESLDNPMLGEVQASSLTDKVAQPFEILKKATPSTPSQVSNRPLSQANIGGTQPSPTMFTDANGVVYIQLDLALKKNPNKKTIKTAAKKKTAKNAARKTATKKATKKLVKSLQIRKLKSNEAAHRN